MLVGHSRLLRRLEHPGPVLVVGPPHTGKKTAIAHYLSGAGARRMDQLWLPGLTADGARQAIRYTASASMLADRKFVIAGLDGASAQSLNILLKVLEEPPDVVRFILTASVRPLATVTSRVRVILAGLLSDRQVADVLVLRGMDEAAAARQARFAQGRIRPALEAAVADAQPKAKVLAALKAVAAGDVSLLDRILRGWDGQAHDLLVKWAWEAATREWRVFDPGPAGLLPADARGMLVLLSRYAGVRPQLAARATLAVLAASRKLRGYVLAVEPHSEDQPGDVGMRP